MSLTEDIKDFALDLGYSKVGITSAEGFPDYAAELQSRYEIFSWYIDSPRQPVTGAIPRTAMPSAKSIISMVFDYARVSFPEKLTGKIGRIYQARCYNAPEDRINGARTKLMREFLEKAGCHVARGIIVPERLTAAYAGIVNYGKNSFAFSEGMGSFIVLSSFVVDVELDYDQPTFEVKCPPKCTACMDVCPTKAIYEPLKMNPRRCIAFNTFWAQDGFPGTTSFIAPEIRDKMGTWIHGCDICQEVCPRNQRRLKETFPHDAFLERIAQDFDLVKLLGMSAEFYHTRIQPLMYNYIRNRKYFQRNAAIAIGNIGDPAFIPALVQALKDPEELVRAYTV
ncbi:MAG: 4Fe-4S double cluster binding domain-containing protein [Syntrophus sp. (in: bacteria)]